MRAIDLYSGVGGWSAGLRCAGIEVVQAYEIWPAAVETYNANLGTRHTPMDVRKLDFKTLPKNIQIVIGSPPCTEFSYSNKGGGGDLAEGLKDLVRFFEVVAHVRPRYWLMENVPRTAEMIETGLRTKGHPLHRFRSLNPEIRILDMADFGLPQSRSRCLIGVFPFKVLESYKKSIARRSLGQVIRALSKGATVQDPVWGFKFDRHRVTEMEPEPPLNAEQLRMNREAKRYHPVYNDMAFPDRQDQPSRTVTATCTRVSRESIVVADSPDGPIRRLTVRERASLQGFPITYQFYGNSHSQKVKMVGNAVPPLFSYLVGRAIHRCQYDEKALAKDAMRLSMPAKLPAVTPPHAVGTSYPAKRRFRSALPTLRFKSGMRFQLVNEFTKSGMQWRIQFFFGPSKDIKSVQLNTQLLGRIKRLPSLSKILDQKISQLKAIQGFTAAHSPEELQKVWSQQADGLGPYKLVDELGKAAVVLTNELSRLAGELVEEKVLACCGLSKGSASSQAKLRRHARAVLCGLILGSWFNSLEWASAKSAPTKQRRSAAG